MTGIAYEKEEGIKKGIGEKLGPVGLLSDHS